jgi:hypothetical protein
MITAYSFGKPGAILVELSYPNTVVKRYATVPNPGDVDRLVHHHSRKYVIEKLKSWLSQWKVALKVTESPTKINEVAQLQVLVNYYQQASLEAIKVAINRHSIVFAYVAPSENAKLYNYYTNTIKPILEYCESNEQTAN